MDVAGQSATAPGPDSVDFPVMAWTGTVLRIRILSADCLALAGETRPRRGQPAEFVHEVLPGSVDQRRLGPACDQFRDMVRRAGGTRSVTGAELVGFTAAAGL